MAEKNVIVDMGDVSKPANTLIKKIAKVIGAGFEPAQIRRVAQAKADAALMAAKADAGVALIAAESEIAVHDLRRRAVERWIAEEERKQENIESITIKAMEYLNDESDAEQIDDDWIANFFDKCRLISDDDMQELWSKVLAGEANSPGAFSKRTIACLSSLDRSDAVIFQSLCSCVWKIDAELVAIVYSEDDRKVYDDRGLNFNSLIHLSEIGLITYIPSDNLQQAPLQRKSTVQYCGEPINIEFTTKFISLAIGNVLLTKVGQQLVPICGAKHDVTFLDFVIGKWTANRIITSCPYPRQLPPNS